MLGIVWHRVEVQKGLVPSQRSGILPWCTTRSQHGVCRRRRLQLDRNRMDIMQHGLRSWSRDTSGRLQGGFRLQRWRAAH